MGYLDNKFESQVERHLASAKRKLGALGRHVVTSHQVLLALAFLYWWGTTSGFIAKTVMLLLGLDFLECWLTTEEKIEFKKDWKVVVMGAGMSGLVQAKRLLDAGVTEFVVLEKSSRLGGTWNYNIYPGIACDIASHLYCFSFYLNPWWTRWFSGGSEIYKYLNKMANHYGITKYIKFDSEVARCDWDETSKTWLVETTSGQTYTANVLINAVGPFPRPNTPKFKGMDKFKGKALHSAEWDPTLDLNGKRVFVVGTGASGIQIVPTVADQVKELTVFQRTAAWVPSRGNWYHTPYFQYALVALPWLNKMFRYFLFWKNEFNFHAGFKENGFLKEQIDKNFTREIHSRLGDREDLKKKLTPTYRFGCKRITPHDHYIKTYLKPNVHLVTEGIEEFTEKGIRTKDGVEREADIIILATGFDMLHSLFPIYGRDKERHMAEIWGDEPRTYLGVTCPNLPNFFYVVGPGSGLGHNTIIYIAECNVTYVMDCLRKLAAAHRTDPEAVSSMRLRERVLADYVEESDKAMKNVAFGNGTCSAWYQNSRGVNWTLYPKDLLSFWWESVSASWEDYIFE